MHVLAKPLLCLFLAISALLLFYYLYFFTRLAFFKKKNNHAKPPAPPLSMIVCAKNEQFHLEKNIPLLLAQQYKAPMELLLVNDDSEDDTKQIMQWMQKSHPQLNVINIERKGNERIGKKLPLSIGIREAAHEHLLLTDADCKPTSLQWSTKIADAYEPGIEIVLGYGAYEKHPGFLNKVIRFETFHSAMQYLSYALAGLPYMGVGRNLSYTKSLFFKHKGFASINHIPGGDDDLFICKASNRNNTAIVIDNEAHTLSVPQKTWSSWRRQKTRHYSTSKYYPRKHQLLLGLYSLSHFLFYPLVVIILLMYSWQLATAVLVIKYLVQYIVFANVMKKLNEQDLIKWIFVMDIWMFFYYLLFANTLWKKEKKTW